MVKKVTVSNTFPLTSEIDVKVSERRNKCRLCCNDLDICQTIQMVVMVVHLYPHTEDLEYEHFIVSSN
jgi:hypothetical protein